MIDLSDFQIVITSFLGTTPEVRKLRMEMHLAQRKILEKQFPDFRILSLCSAYTDKERKKLSPFESYHIDKPKKHFEKQNIIFKELDRIAKLGELKSIMIFDDDSVPDEENEFKLDTLGQLREWLANPKDMPASMVFFSGRGYLHDTYTNNRPPTITTAPLRVIGCMFMVRSDFSVRLSEDVDVNHYITKKHVCLDTMLRMQMAAKGYSVAKHRGIFFKGSCRATGTVSTKTRGKNFHGTKEKVETLSSVALERRENKFRTYDQITHFWPYLFVPWKGDKKRPLPVWQLRGKRLNVLLNCGALKMNKHGVIYPNPDILKKRHEYHSQRPTLLGLIKKEK